MKTAKEWAADTVTDAYQDDGVWIAKLRDDVDYVLLDTQLKHDVAQSSADDARAIIERLVARVQADARAQMEEAAAHREAYVVGLQREANEWRRVACDRGRVLGDVVDALEELRGSAAPGSAAEDICDLMLPKIEEALR